MISVSEAKEIVNKNVTTLPPKKLNLLEAAGKILASDVYSEFDIPAFDQSSMDGYAIRFEDKETLLNIKGELPAGTSQRLSIYPGEAARIFTGAPLPEGADTVVMQEKVKVHSDKIKVEDPGLKRAINVRIIGSETKRGSLALKQGTILSPAAIGFLAGIGIVEVLVYPTPSISLIVTGKELQIPGKPLQHGQVYESNSYSLRAALQKEGIHEIQLMIADDDLTELTHLLKKALDLSDIVLLAGGVSVGDYDFVIEATKQCGVQQLFHKVKQRPGKPLYFGKKGNKLVFGLPGNPSSVLTCFYQYVIPALRLLSPGNSNLRTLNVPLSKCYAKQVGLTHFLKGYFDGETALALDAQESYRMRSYAQSNCLIEIDEDVTECNEGTSVKIYLLP